MSRLDLPRLSFAEFTAATDDQKSPVELEERKQLQQIEALSANTTNGVDRARIQQFLRSHRQVVIVGIR